MSKMVQVPAALNFGNVTVLVPVKLVVPTKLVRPLYLDLIDCPLSGRGVLGERTIGSAHWSQAT